MLFKLNSWRKWKMKFRYKKKGDKAQKLLLICYNAFSSSTYLRRLIDIRIRYPASLGGAYGWWGFATAKRLCVTKVRGLSLAIFFFHDLHIIILCSGLKQKTICLKDGKLACHENCHACDKRFIAIFFPPPSFSVSSLLSRATIWGHSCAL